ncbi:KTSC domain-containing protein [Paenibacillus radicis (ex Xue et al. 2023)]|uniref:KTSC domain-containing protein n=1 Tax=Paenibacillus radicis (ex Xue et al. 2023) TaxID=2972489 RepID=A0ABT1YM27_9BACL|nr:KTSC domain-containing protein [Paenibacillus radicis (ex Xue et al. 2023)]MCR8633449.1 KTSC domain-containing protein [Paenibacillus radicis (ex Xue et al. 2023)]
MELTPVISSNIAAVGYDNIQNILHIQFKGKETIYIYQGVPVGEFEAMMESESVGSYYARNIKNKYSSKLPADKE